MTSLQALTPPAEAQDAHDGLISAGEDLVSEVDTLSTDLQAIEPGAEFDQWADDAQARGLRALTGHQWDGGRVRGS